MFWCIFIAVAILSVPAETVRDKALKHFDRIQWTTNPSYMQPVPPAGKAVVGGNESFVALTVTSPAAAFGVYPQIDRVGLLYYGDCDQKLVQVLEKLKSGLLEKKVPKEQVSNSRKFLPAVTEYRLEKIPNPEYCFYSRPTGDVPELQVVTIVLLCTVNTVQNELFLYGTFAFENGLWKITDIIFDSESYANFIE